MKYNHLIYLLMSFFMACVNAGCKDDTFLSSETEEKDGNGIYVSIMVNTGENGVSRANATPTPGEKGDGLQHGMGDENKIYSLIVYFFQGEEINGERMGINSSNPENIPVYKLEFDSDELYGGNNATNNYDAVYYSVTKEVSEIGLNIGQTYDVLVIVNPDLLKFSNSINCLKDLQDASLRDIIIDNSNNGITTYQFLMASATSEFNADKGVNSVKINATNTKNNPAVVYVDVERMAARVDCHIDNNGEYNVIGRNGDKVELQSLIVVNKYIANVDEYGWYLPNSGSYWFKRVTEDLTTFSNIEYLGDEKILEMNGVAGNYVLGPMTLTPPKIIDRTENFPYDHSLYYYKNDHSGWEKNWISTTDLLSRHLTSTHNDVTYHFLDYVQENILPVDVLNQANGMAYYCTGIVFKAKYIPEGITTDDGTFYRYNGKFYGSLDEIKKVIGNQSISENNLSQFGITKYQDGICYYTYFIKHAEDGDDTKVSPMEYAIVRNNIYQVNVKGINDIGSVTPTDYRLNLECTVTDWITENEITIDFSNNYKGDISGVNVVMDNNDVFVAYSQDNEVRDAQFKFQMNRPVGVGWTAHLTNPDDFEFVGDYHGVGKGDPVSDPVTLQIRPRRAFEEGVERTTEMYITIETDSSPLNFNIESGSQVKFPGDGDAIRIRQVSTIEYDNQKNQGN
ncbi:Mfa1 family fimbria major subunit [uncultured Bacteroides sp.]|uniref:Mfa1 family fimbria major subunit n=1 Tax=uncultured Bacteroides sp. TaxID=162156 RepID=UPI0026352E6A|nr:Mfa1 family fimbria major subunit [uncultured Bacteroides sp.]